MTTFTIIDADGTTLGFTQDAGARCVAGFVPADGDRLLHPAFAEQVAREARTVGFWESVASMDEPEGIRSDDSRPRWPAMLTNTGPVRS